MGALAAIPRWTVEQYLDLERLGPVRHEYLDGYVYALAGGSQAHSVISANLVAALRVALRGGPCRVFTSDLKARVSERRFLYPDVSVGCDPADRRDTDDWLAAPRVVIEVLSESTAAYDRGDKHTLYSQNEALRDYVLVDASERLVEVRSRQPGGAWERRTYGPGTTVALPSLDVQIPIGTIYEDVDLDLS